MSIPSEDAIARHMTLIYLVGAAKADATPEQIVELKALAERLRDPKVSLGDVAQGVFDIMGAGTWVPGPTWLAAIDAIRGETNG